MSVRLYIIAGEPSGDLLAGRLMAALKQRGAVEFYGIGGPAMEAQGLNSLFPMQELSVMGLAEILPHIPHFLGRIHQTVSDAKQKKPDLFLSVDSPGFSLRVSRRLKGSGFPLVHYVAPSVWAWKPGRARKIAAWLDHLLTLLPFEPPYFTCHGLQTTFVGHACLESQPVGLDSTECRTKLRLDPACSTLAVLPGSRTGELSRIGPVFTQVISRLHGLYGDKIQTVVPCVDHLSAQVRELVKSWPVRPIICPQADKYKAFAAAHVALAASGTATLELAVASVPTVVGYRVHPLSAWMVRRLIRTRYYSLPNILLQRELQPERIQDDCRPDLLTAEIRRFLDDPHTRQKSDADCAKVRAMLSPAGRKPSEAAATVLFNLIERHQNAAKTTT